MAEVLPESYTFQKEKLIGPIRKASILRGLGIPIHTNMKAHQNTTKITTVSDDPNIAIAPEPVAGIRSTNSVVQVRKEVPVISAPVSYDYDELLRIDDGVLPFDKRMEILGHHIADLEEAFAFALSSTGVRDSDSIPFIQGGTAVTDFDLETGDLAMVGLMTNIGKMITRYGDLKNRPLVLGFNAVSYVQALKLVSSKNDTPFLTLADAALKEHGGAGSGYRLINRLSCAITQEDDVITITNSANEAMALMLIDGNHFEIESSPLAQRSDGVSEIRGLEINVIERFFPYVHDALSILREDNVDIA